VKRFPLPLKQSAKAKRDLNEISEHLLIEAGAITLTRMLKAVDHTGDLIRYSPMIGRHCGFTSSKSKNVRRISISSPFDKWLIFYTPTPTKIRIERVLHGSRNWSVLFP
jgi:plasmid stabilization system protein ParE